MGRMNYNKYPRCWKRVSRLIRRLANGHCEWCGSACDNLSVHHIGTPFVGRPGNKRDKHDIRRENLVAICFTCHDQADQLRENRAKYQARKAKRAAKRRAHAALNLGSGLDRVGCRALADRPQVFIPLHIIDQVARIYAEIQEQHTVEAIAV